MDQSSEHYQCVEKDNSGKVIVADKAISLKNTCSFFEDSFILSNVNCTTEDGLGCPAGSVCCDGSCHGRFKNGRPKAEELGCPNEGDSYCPISNKCQAQCASACEPATLQCIKNEKSSCVDKESQCQDGCKRFNPSIQ